MSYFTTNNCYDCCLVYPKYNHIYTPYNQTNYHEALASSGAISLGNAAGTDRSISGEFGGSTPHALSEYYGVASGIPSSGTIDFSDFHGKSAANEEFRWLYLQTGGQTSQQCAICCAILCTYKCCIHPSSSSLHNCLEKLDIYYSSNHTTIGTMLAACYSAGCDYTAIFWAGSINIVKTGFSQCLCCAVKTHGTGFVTGQWVGGLHNYGFWSTQASNGTHPYLDDFRLVAPNGNNSNDCAAYSNIWSGFTDIDLSSHSASTHSILCNVCCISGEDGKSAHGCCYCLNSCTTDGSSTNWVCTGSVHSICGGMMFVYGDPCSKFSGAGRQVALNVQLDHDGFGLCGLTTCWDNSDYGGGRLVTNSLIWASRGAL